MRAELVVQAVLAADERRAQRDGHVVAGQGRADQRAERLRPVGVAPAEVVEDGDPRADRPRRPRSCAPPRRSRWPPSGTCRGRRSTGSCRRRSTMPRRLSSTGRSTAASLGPSFATPTSGLIDAAALHLVVVLADDPFLAGHVERAEDLQQRRRCSRSRGVAAAGISIADCGSTGGLDRPPRAPPAAGRRAGTPSPGRPPAGRGTSAPAGPSARTGR